MKKIIMFFILTVGIIFFGFTQNGMATTLTYHATADNAFYLYISTSPTVDGDQIAYGNNWGATYSGSVNLTAGNTLYLHVYGINWGGPGSFIGDFTLSDTGFTFANGSQKLVTDGTYWTVTTSPDWTTGSTAASTYGYNGVGPWGYRSGIDSNAQWIWTTDYNGSPAYLSTTLTASAVPIPAAFWLLGSGLAGLVGMRRRITSKLS